MNVYLVLILLLQAATGIGVQASVRAELPRSMALPLSVLLGMFLHTLTLLLANLVGVPINSATVMASAAIPCIATHVRWRVVQDAYVALFARPRWTLRMYDVVPLVVLLYLSFLVVWAGWYWPVTPFDAMAGIDLVARQTVEQGTINNRVFSDPSLAGQLSNQPFYAPFAMLMQTIYRCIGFEHGQLWVSIMSVAFGWFMWSALRTITHGFIANILFVLYVLTPEMFGYAYLLQTDYLNAAFVASGAILLWRATVTKGSGTAWLAAILFAGGCWSRTETIALVVLGVAASMPLLAKSFSWKHAVRYAAVTSGIAVVVFALWHVVYFDVVLPVRPETSEQISGFTMSGLTGVVERSFTSVIADKELWAASYLVFLIVFVGSALYKRSVAPLMILAWIVVIHVGLWIVGATFSAAIVEQTFRRGIFKVIPLLFVYAAASPIVETLSRRLLKWEAGENP